MKKRQGYSAVKFHCPLDCQDVAAVVSAVLMVIQMNLFSYSLLTSQKRTINQKNISYKKDSRPDSVVASLLQLVSCFHSILFWLGSLRLRTYYNIDCVFYPMSGFGYKLYLLNLIQIIETKSYSNRSKRHQDQLHSVQWSKTQSLSLAENHLTSLHLAYGSSLVWNVYQQTYAMSFNF